MNNFHQQLTALRSWAKTAEETGWINRSGLEAIDQIEQQTADDLFLKGSQRPLVVALFGGTGAGKSSLLNRLAGESIARTGVERPTSHEITLFLHQAYQLNALPTELPTEKVNIRYHNDDRRKLIAWLDMPDFDSTETSNRDLVEIWLPYIDWLVYVVTPERYQDDIGWRFLQQRNERHHWLFVMNHWDESSPEQIDDFRNKLMLENIHSATILRTSCIKTELDDDFEQLEQSIQDAVQEHGLAVLKTIGLQARIDDLKQLIRVYQSTLGSETQWQAAELVWQQQIKAGISSIRNALSTQSTLAVQTLQQEEKSGSGFWRKRKTAAQLPPPETISGQIWSPRIDTLTQDLAQTLKAGLQQQQLSAKPAAQPLASWQQTLSTPLRKQLTTALSHSMAKPGSPARRFLWKLSGWLSILLPLAAAIWVVFHVVQRFYAGTQGLEEFLDSKFAIHSLLMIGLGWLIPWLLQRQLQPSINQAARQGLKVGTDEFLDQLNSELLQIFQDVREKRNHVIKALASVTQS